MEYLKAFLIGGIFCLIGQILIDKTKLTPARILVGYVVAGVILSAVGLYQPIADFAGTGASVPLTGFGHLLAKGVKEAIAEQGFIGILTGGRKPVTGQCQADSLTGAVASERVTEALKGWLSADGNRAKSVNA